MYTEYIFWENNSTDNIYYEFNGSYSLSFHLLITEDNFKRIDGINNTFTPNPDGTNTKLIKNWVSDKYFNQVTFTLKLL
jgi:hypothetical protein